MGGDAGRDERGNESEREVKGKRERERKSHIDRQTDSNVFKKPGKRRTHYT